MEIKMSKTQQVLQHLEKSPITSWEAIQLYKATRLADIIFKLKNRGFNIYTKMEENNDVKFARYYLIKQASLE
jgi:hypothetical protein